MTSKNKQPRKEAKNMTPVQVKGTIYNIHTNVMEAIQHMMRQHEHLMREYKTLLSVSKAMSSQLEKMLVYLSTCEPSDELMALIEETQNLCSSKDAKETNQQYESIAAYKKPEEPSTL